MTRIIGQFLMFLFLLVASCKNDSIEKNPYFTIIDDPISTGVYVNVEGLNKMFTINSNVSWEILANSTETWASISPTKGSGNGFFALVVKKNETIYPREMSFVMMVDGKVQDKPLEVHQKSINPQLSLTPDTDIDVLCDGGIYSVLVNSDITNWTFNIIDGDDWCRGIQKSDGIELAIDFNNGLSPRQATLNVMSPDFLDLTVSVTISQSADPSCAVDAVVTFDYLSPITSNFESSVTHTQYSLDKWGDPAAVALGRTILSSSVAYQVQALMGWGTINPWVHSTERNPAYWDWSSLDSRVSLMRETGAKPVITLCGSPTWMHSPSQDGTTDWTKLESAPLPENYDNFAFLCAEVAKRYPDVLHFQVWNEMKGFYLKTENRWDYENYTLMYNKVYDALMDVNPDLKIGGPYVSVDSWSSSSAGGYKSNLTGSWGTIDKRALDVITHWLDNKRGGSFIIIDGGNRNRDTPNSNTSGFESIEKFLKLYDWLRLQTNGGASLPVWWTEFYVNPTVKDPVDNDAIKVAVQAAAMSKCILKGYARLIMWGPEGDETGASFPIGLWTRTNVVGGGQPTQLTSVFKYFHDYFSTGTILYPVTYSDNQKVTALASENYLLFVNQTNDILKVRYNTDQFVELSAYEVKLIQQNHS